MWQQHLLLAWMAPASTSDGQSIEVIFFVFFCFSSFSLPFRKPALKRAKLALSAAKMELKKEKDQKDQSRHLRAQNLTDLNNTKLCFIVLIPEAVLSTLNMDRTEMS